MASLFRRFTGTFRGRLALTYVFVESSILLISAFLLYFSLSYKVYKQLDDDLLRQVATLAQQMESRPFYMWRALLEHFVRDFDGALQIVSARGRVEFSWNGDLIGHGNRHVLSAYRRALRTQRPAFVSTSSLLGKESMRVLALPIHRGDQVPAVLLAAMSSMQIQGFFTWLYLIGGSLALFSIFVSAWAGYQVTLKALAPIREINHAARAVAAGDLSRRLQSKAQDREIRELVVCLNRMFQALEDSFIAQKRFTADASHELRIPLTILKGEIEVALRKSRTVEEHCRILRKNLSIVENMQRIVDDLLMLARADAGQLELVQETVDFSLLMQEVYQQYLILFSEKGLRLEAEIQDDLQVLGDASALERVVFNLLNNAYKYAPPGSAVELCARAQGERVRVRVRDSGPGIPKEHQPYLFDRFYRSDEARTRQDGGAGLGLAICKRIVDAHGGDIRVESEPGKGATFVIDLPLSGGNPETQDRLRSVMRHIGSGNG